MNLYVETIYHMVGILALKFVVVVVVIVEILSPHVSVSVSVQFIPNNTYLLERVGSKNVSKYSQNCT